MDSIFLRIKLEELGIITHPKTIMADAYADLFTLSKEYIKPEIKKSKRKITVFYNKLKFWKRLIN